MKTKKFVLTAMLIAVGTLLSFFQIIRLPFGGSVTLLSMMPVILIAWMYGTRWGVFSAFVYSVLQLVCGMGTVSAFFLPGDSKMALGAALCVCILDYILAYTMLGFGGIFRDKIKNESLAISLGALVALTLRLVMHVISGAVFFGAWAEWFFADSSGLSQISIFKGFCDWVMQTFSGGGKQSFQRPPSTAEHQVPFCTGNGRDAFATGTGLMEDDPGRFLRPGIQDQIVGGIGGIGCVQNGKERQNRFGR